MTVYMPSYFNDLKEREILFKNCIESYLKLGFEIVIVWMNKGFDKIENPNITYIDAEIQNASKARNLLLDIFYDNNEDYCYLSDDDTVFFGYDGRGRNSDCISFTNDLRKNDFNTTNISSALLKLKNLRKYYNTRLYFDENLEANQDYDFARNLLQNKFSTEIINSKNVQINKGISSMFKTPQERLQKKMDTYKLIMKKEYDIKNI